MRDRSLLALEAGDVAEILSRIPLEVAAAVHRVFEDPTRKAAPFGGSPQEGWLGVQLERGGLVLLEARQVALASAAATVQLVAPALGAATWETPRLGLVGCDELNGSVLDGLLRAWPAAKDIVLWDPEPSRRFAFLASRSRDLRDRQVWLACDLETVLGQCELVSITAPGAVEREMLRAGKPGGVVVSLGPGGLPAAVQPRLENVVDVVEELSDVPMWAARERGGPRRCSPLRAVIRAGTLRRPARSVAVFHRSPRSRADLAVARLVAEVATAQGRGQWLDEFFSTPSPPPAPLFGGPRAARASLHPGGAP